MTASHQLFEAVSAAFWAPTSHERDEPAKIASLYLPGHFIGMILRSSAPILQLLSAPLPHAGAIHL